MQGRETIYGVVFNAYTHSLEPNRLAIAYHRSEQELRDEQPQIFELLKTKFEAVIIGYETEALSDSTCHHSHHGCTALCISVSLWKCVG